MRSNYLIKIKDIFTDETYQTIVTTKDSNFLIKLTKSTRFVIKEMIRLENFEELSLLKTMIL